MPIAVTRTIEAFSGEKTWTEQLALFPDDREELPMMDCETIRVQLDKIELRFHREWYLRSAMGNLPGEDYSLAQKNKPYRCLVLLLEHGNEPQHHIRCHLKKTPDHSNV